MSLVKVMTRTQRGFTLIETLAALLVFSIATLGIVPLITAAINGTNVARSQTVGKNAALEAMERIRGLPFYVEYTPPSTIKEDVLDLFYPDTVGTAIPGQAYANGLFTTTCTTASTANPACLATKLPGDLPNFQLVVRACFVNTGASQCIDTAANRAIPTNYQWNPPAGSTTVSDAPPASAQLVELSVTSRWNLGGQQRSFDIRTLLGDKDFGGVTVRGVASITNGVSVTTSYQYDPNGPFDADATDDRKTTLTADFGAANSRIQATNLRTSAEEVITAGALRLLDVTDEANATEVAVATGATGAAQAPPDVTPLDQPGPSRTISHPTGSLAGSQLGFLNESTAFDQTAGTQNDLAVAEGSFSLNDADGADATDPRDMHGWVSGPRNQPDLLLHPSDPLLFISGPTAPYMGTTAAETRNPADGVRTAAELSVPEMGLIPSTVIPDGTAIDGSPASTIVAIRDFDASVECLADPNGTAVATAEWSGDLYYWADRNNNDIADGSYVLVPLGTTTGSTDPLVDVTTENPVVIEFQDTVLPLPDPQGHPNDVHLFPFEHDHGTYGPHTHKGFLNPTRGWSSTGLQDEEASSDGRIARASVSQAIQLRTVALDTSTNNSFVTVSVGALNCSAEDQR